jgi:hypothetical protein
MGLMNFSQADLLSEIADKFEQERNKHPNWIDMHNFRYWKSGEKYFTDFHLTVPNYMTVEEGHAATHDIEDICKEIFHTDEVEVLVHLDPCKPECCRQCRINTCHIRTSAFIEDYIWTDKKIIDKAPYLAEETRYN